MKKERQLELGNRVRFKKGGEIMTVTRVPDRNGRLLAKDAAGRVAALASSTLVRVGEEDAS